MSASGRIWRNTAVRAETPGCDEYRTRATRHAFGGSIVDGASSITVEIPKARITCLAHIDRRRDHLVLASPGLDMWSILLVQSEFHRPFWVTTLVAMAGFRLPMTLVVNQAMMNPRRSGAARRRRDAASASGSTSTARGGPRRPSRNHHPMAPTGRTGSRSPNLPTNAVISTPRSRPCSGNRSRNRLRPVTTYARVLEIPQSEI